MLKKAKRTKKGVGKRTARTGTAAKRGKGSRPARGRARAKSRRGVPKVRVRMYRQGLGDCFLVTFDVGGDERHMLIDCGTLGAKSTKVKLADVVKDIRMTTNDHLDVLVATHEHQDHVSGFGSLDEEFEQMTIDRVWLAWTEDPDDKFAQQIAMNKRDLGEALTAVAKAPSAAGVAPQIRDLLGFFGSDVEDGVFGAGDFAKTVDRAMHFVRKGLGVQALYLRPGREPIEEDWLPGFRFYVLGPPKSEEALRDLGEHGSSELYALGAGLRAAGLRAAALREIHARNAPRAARAGAGALPEPEVCEQEMPFDMRFRMSTKRARENIDRYFAESDRWRAIDADWLRLATDLALQLDKATNNSSLVLAIERIADGKILLFPGDAQQGSLLSWHDPRLKWMVPHGRAGRSRDVTAADLLRRTVFYKVGHHGSHNATAKEKGLELMDDDELTAFIPVDRAIALNRNPKDSWKMPARALYRRLLEKCTGRVVRSDIGWAADAASAADKAVEKEFRSLGSAQEWERWVRAQRQSGVTIEELFAECVL